MSTDENKDLLKAARDFARTKNRGLSSRVREKLDGMKPALAHLVSERLSISDIQEFIRQQTGMKIGIATLKQYCQDTFNYPAAKSTQKSS
ncbi:hypothetical protein [Chromobacterium haemolyticum]|uniref:hypothetical protein n=1 Tax=Chromobacterium haemolyticum TaxID=394935 RepID=UPI002448A756|nr:hypothetical protein [Chromobacterium haemolyticum]MDH0342034.1 hypothetical protein [Chromobacterium haemolyticum]